MKKTTLLLIILCVIITAVYWDSLDNEFAYDDIFFITTNTYIQDIGHWKTYFTQAESTSFKDHGVYRPFRTLSYALDYRWGKLAPRGYHIVNVLLHVITTLLVYLFCVRVFSFAKIAQAQTVSVLAAFFFGPPSGPVRSGQLGIMPGRFAFCFFLHRGNLAVSAFFGKQACFR